MTDDDDRVGWGLSYDDDIAHWDSIGTFRDSPTDLCIAGALLFIYGPVPNLVMG